jgi:hypothetical protein
MHVYFVASPLLRVRPQDVRYYTTVLWLVFPVALVLAGAVLAKVLNVRADRTVMQA